MPELNLSLISQASTFLEGKIKKTPLEFSPIFSELLNVPAYLKMEFLQITGSFKLRGALFYLSTLSDQEKQNGVAACSAGNHGLGVAYAAKLMGANCTVYAPKNLDNAKHKKILQLGANVQCSQFVGYDDTLEWTKSEVDKKQQHLISAFDDERIMAGNGGTLAAEILNDVPDMQNLIVPVGGGGLSGGMAYYLKTKNPSIRIVGSQLKASPALQLSLERGEAVVKLPSVDTFAGGIEGGIGKKCFEILKSRIDDVVLLSEEEIIQAFCWMLKNQQFLIEPTSSASVAACLTSRLKLKGPTVIVLSGRNVGYTTIQQLVR